MSNRRSVSYAEFFGAWLRLDASTLSNNKEAEAKWSNAMIKKALLFLVFIAVIGSAPAGKPHHQSRPDEKQIKALGTIRLTYKIKDGNLILKWSPANAEPSAGIKITRSESNKSPLYPYDGYVQWLPGTGHTQSVIKSQKAADGKSYFYRVCSVKKGDHRQYTALSNVIRVPAIIPSGKYSAGKKERTGYSGKSKSDKSYQEKHTEYKKKSAEYGKTYHKKDKKKSFYKDKKSELKPTLPGKSGSSTSGKTTKRSSQTKEPLRPRRYLVANYLHTDINRIPVHWIEVAKRKLRVWYGHTSHGSQITSGMSAMNSPPFNFNHSGSGGALSYREASGDLGHRGNLMWKEKTKAQLDRPDNTRNVVMWSWCGGCSDNTEDGINKYIAAMDQLEHDYPDVIFVYMTGHLDGTRVQGNLNRRNNQIREYCKSNQKVLFDFAAIESIDPDGISFLELGANDGCFYDSDGDGRKDSNWADEWLAAHPDNNIALPNRAAHTRPLNAALKGRAFWYLLARLAGWDGH